MKTVIAVTFAIATGLGAATCASAQDAYNLHGNGPVVIVAPNAAGVPYGSGYSGYGSGLAPYGNSSGVLVTPRGAVPYGRYNKDAARDAFRINTALGGARAADEAAARNQAPLTPLNPLPGGLR
jgi:hypothetical protein